MPASLSCLPHSAHLPSSSSTQIVVHHHRAVSALVRRSVARRSPRCCSLRSLPSAFPLLTPWRQEVGCQEEDASEYSSAPPRTLLAMDAAPERELLPGVFVTDFRSAAPSSSSHEHKQPPLPHSSTSSPSSDDHKASSSPSSSLPSRGPAPSSSSPAHVDMESLSQLSFDLSVLQNSIDHLIASQAEMAAAMEEDGDDDGEYAKALRENIDVIDRKQRQAEGDAATHRGRTRRTRGGPPSPPALRTSSSTASAIRDVPVAAVQARALGSDIAVRCNARSMMVQGVAGAQKRSLHD